MGVGFELAPLAALTGDLEGSSRALRTEGRFCFWTAPRSTFVATDGIPSELDIGIRRQDLELVAGFQSVKYLLAPAGSPPASSSASKGPPAARRRYLLGLEQEHPRGRSRRSRVRRDLLASRGDRARALRAHLRGHRRRAFPPDPRPTCRGACGRDDGGDCRSASEAGRSASVTYLHHRHLERPRRADCDTSGTERR